MVTKLDKITENVVQLLEGIDCTVATAESCTGGLLSGAITSVSGASSVFGYGVCTYANEAKMKLIGVKAETLDEYGAVSCETAREMAEGIRKLSGAGYGVSTTGIAGPKSDDTNKPVGLCYIAVGMKDGVHTYRYNLIGSREEITETAKNTALFLAIKKLKNL